MSSSPLTVHVWTLMLVLSIISFAAAATTLNQSQAPPTLPPSSNMVVKEGSNTLLHCNVSGNHSDIRWFNPRGDELGVDAGGKWQQEDGGVLNVTSVSFLDRGRYTCVSSSGASFVVTLRVSYGAGGLGVYYVAVCLVAFAVTMVINAARLCMVSAHLKETERAINDFFRTEGAEKLQKAFAVAKHIPIVTSARTLELAKATHGKTKELLRHVEELARSIPLPPLLLSCGGFAEEAELDAAKPTPLHQGGAAGGGQEVRVKVAEEEEEDEDGKVL